MPFELLGYGVVSPVDAPAPEADEIYALHINTPDDDTAFRLDGLVSHLWVDNTNGQDVFSARGRYFYAYKLKDAMVWLSGADDNVFIRWRDSQGTHLFSLPSNNQE